MRLRLSRKFVALAVLTIGGLFWMSAPAYAQAAIPELSATIDVTKASQPSVQLKNISARSCQVATTAYGTVAITKLSQNGQVIKSSVVNSASDDDIGYLLQSQLKTLAPGEKVDIPLLVYKINNEYLLRSVSWSSDAGAYSTQFSIQPDKPLSIELSYSLPITPKSGEPACGMVLASTFNNNGPLATNVIIALWVLVIAIVIFILWWFIRKKRKAPKKLGAIVVLLLAIGLNMLFKAPVVHADISVPPDMQSAFNSCMATFESNRDITGPVLDVINDPANHVDIVGTTGGSDMTGRPNEGGGSTFTIYWNPNDRHGYHGSGGNADPCTSLYHEMYHAYDMANGTFSRDDCAGSGIDTKEVMATRAQNALRERLGMPARSHYGDRALPSGECTEPADPDECTGEHCADSNGDPHLRTFDGLRYDFQAVGEFTASRNQSGSYEVQVRQEPWVYSRVASLNTAVAIKLGNDKVEVQAGLSPKLLINGTVKPLQASDLPGGGKISLSREVVVLTWPDGSKAYVRPVGTFGLALSLQISNDLAGKVEGLLGNADGKNDNDLKSRGSTKSIKPTHSELYPVFADSWRVSDQTSLFTYDQGKNTASYTDKSFPDELKDAKSLPNYDAAEAFCKTFGVSDPSVLANCAFDVAITGRPEFARGAKKAQTFVRGTNLGGTTWELTVKNPGERASVKFDGKAGEKVFIDVPFSSIPSQCSPLQLLDPSDQQIAEGCVINGKGEIDSTTLPSTGTYTFVLRPDSIAGTATARLFRISDKEGSITPDGASLSVNIDKPGVVGRYSFGGQAGQRVFVDIPTSTLPSQCGFARILGTDNREIASGCIINGLGNIDTVTLPANGQYTLVLDPDGSVTGTTTLRLILATLETKPISLDGQIVELNLAKPGSVGKLTFNGAAGKRIFVDITTSELPSQCGVLVLRGPDGNALTSGCIINRKGNLVEKGYILPQSGEYSLILDPYDNIVGKSSLRLRSGP